MVSVESVVIYTLLCAYANDETFLYEFAYKSDVLIIIGVILC